MSNPFVLAAAQFPTLKPENWSQFQQTVADWVAEAVRQHARLLVFPEYSSMVLAGLLPEPMQADVLGQIGEIQRYRDDYVALHQRLAQRHGVYIVAGSYPWEMDTGVYVNRAWVFAPNGGMEHQDKRVMTRFEREEWDIRGGAPLKLFETELGRFGINICYDIEFPLLARAQVEAGAELILAPSCTDTLGGYHRVRTGCAARALENQCFTVQVPLVGTAPWSPAIDVSHGSAAIFGPPDRGFPDNGILVQGGLNDPSWVYAEVDLSRVGRVRDEGEVYNHRHWHDQLGPGIEARLPEVTPVSL